MSNVSYRRSPVLSRAGSRLSDSQNFITDRTLIERLLRHVKHGGADTIVEIGPGKGALTGALGRLAPQVLAIEADAGLVHALVKRFADSRGISIVHGDFLCFPLPARPFIVVANIPFNRTAEIVRKLTGESSGLTAAYLIMQKEAALKFVSDPARPASLLSHLLNLEFAMEIICDVPRGCFTPRPGVDAAFALFRKRKIPILCGADALQFKDLLCYLHPRGPLAKVALRHVFTSKQANRLLGELHLGRRARLCEICLEAWLKAFELFDGHASQAARSKVKGAFARLKREQAGLEKRHRTS